MCNKLVMISAATALALGSAPAFAQSQPSSQPGTSSPSSSTTTSSAIPKAMSQDKVRQVMRDAGFTNVQVLDASYLVSAQTKDGDRILVVLNPPMMDRTGAPATTGSTGGASSGSAGSSGSSASGSTQTTPKQ